MEKIDFTVKTIRVGASISAEGTITNASSSEFVPLDNILISWVDLNSPAQVGQAKTDRDGKINFNMPTGSVDHVVEFTFKVKNKEYKPKKTVANQGTWKVA
jgi:hypothetical protein